MDKAYSHWKQKYLSRENSCRVYALPSSQLHPDMLRPARAYPAPGTSKENLDKSAANAVDDALSFVQHNEVSSPALLKAPRAPSCAGCPHSSGNCEFRRIDAKAIYLPNMSGDLPVCAVVHDRGLVRCPGAGLC